MLLLPLVGFFLALMVITAKAAVGAGIQPVTLALTTNLGAGLVLLAVARLSRNLPTRSRRDLALYFALAIFTFSFPNAMTYAVADRVGPAYTSSVYALSPLMTFAVAAGFGVERLSLLRFVGLTLGFVGTALLVFQQVAGDLDTGLVWILFGLTIPASVAVGNVLRTAFWPAGASPLAFACATLIASALQLFVVWLVFRDATAAAIAGNQVMWSLAMVAVASLLYLGLFRLQQIAGPVFMSQIGYWSTGFGVILSALIFDDFIALIGFVGIFLIVAGAVLARRRLT